MIISCASAFLILKLIPFMAAYGSQAVKNIIQLAEIANSIKGKMHIF